jgi:hypothetical protein
MNSNVAAEKPENAIALSSAMRGFGGLLCHARVRPSLSGIFPARACRSLPGIEAVREAARPQREPGRDHA